MVLARTALRLAEDLWRSLAASRAEEAFRAIGELTARPEVALPLFKARLRPTAKPALQQAGDFFQK